MKIILASSNKGKIVEIQTFFKNYQILAYSDILGEFEIEENGTTFKENAIIKANAVYEKLNEKQKQKYIVLADDSGISVEELGGIPGIYSARFAGKNASSKENLEKLIQELKKAKLAKTPAFYTAAMALATKNGIFTAHGWMHGDVIDTQRGENGFGYDPMFIPKGFDKTLGELEWETKEAFSHRTNALRLIELLI